MMTCSQFCSFRSHQQHVAGPCFQHSRVLWPNVREQRGNSQQNHEHLCKSHSKAFQGPAQGCLAAHTVRGRLGGMQSSDPVSPAASMIKQVLGSLVAPAAAVVLAGMLLFECPVGIAHAKTRLTADEQLTVDLFRRNTPSVVFITNLAVRRDAFTLDMMEIPQGAGSGFIWDTDGHVVTNFHVIKGASDLQVTLTDGDEYAAEVVGFDGDKDIAVLQLKMPDTVNNQEKLHPVKLGTSEDLLVGQRVYAIGNPFGLDHTLTTGVISGTGREISSGNTGRPIENVIQTDAAINPGNSGGPLLNSSGELIGVNTAIYSPSGANSGVGFAVPVDIINSSVTQIIKFGKVIRPILGISFAPDQSIEQLQLGVQGILVLDARDSGPAGKAGVHGTKRDQNGRLVLGDIITGFNSMRVRNASDLYKALDKCGIGDEVDLELLRDNDKMHIKITLGASS